MEKEEAEGLLRKLREEIDQLRSDPQLTYGKVQKLASEVAQIGELLSNSADESGRVSVLSPEQFKQLQELTRKIRLLHRSDTVTTIMTVPAVSQQEYLRKTLWQIDEEIAALLYSLREEK